jgi:hypothetical protein
MMVIYNLYLVNIGIMIKTWKIKNIFPIVTMSTLCQADKKIKQTNINHQEKIFPLIKVSNHQDLLNNINHLKVQVIVKLESKPMSKQT